MHWYIFMHLGCFALKLLHKCARRVDICIVVHKETAILNLYKHARSEGITNYVIGVILCQIVYNFRQLFNFYLIFRRAGRQNPHTDTSTYTGNERHPETILTLTKVNKATSGKFVYSFHQWHFEWSLITCWADDSLNMCWEFYFRYSSVSTQHTLVKIPRFDINLTVIGNVHSPTSCNGGELLDTTA